MNISITPELEKFVNQEVKTGLYQSASEVIRAALRRLKEDKERKPRFVVSSRTELEDKLLEGISGAQRAATRAGVSGVGSSVGVGAGVGFRGFWGVDMLISYGYGFEAIRNGHRGGQEVAVALEKQF